MAGKFYSGIGSRATNIQTGEIISKVASYLAKLDYTLRSGGAEGADTFFENGAGYNKEIYLPWKGFNDNLSIRYTPTLEAFQMAAEYHPSWGNLSQPVKRLMARNCHQVLGLDLKTPVEFVLYWQGERKGGTEQALRIARDLDIPMYNFAQKEEMLKFKEYMLC